ncbi:Bifunctional NAD(P)H-hydrate repair enzyme Nnr [bacterium HR29]|jgi:NAD(P)H-hydrate epimerase|nr:Bifunctional NAD(P)H-hydrate repair enzyme Nnr [bacterium HR29]
MKLVTVEEMRRLEEAAVEAGVSERQMMEEAGLAVAQEAWMALGTLEGRRIAVLVGPGNNGGDALVAARHLADWGAEVAVFAPMGRKPDELRAEAEARGIPIAEGEEALGPALERALTDADLVIDGLLGIGKARPIDPRSPLGRTLEALRAARSRRNPPKLVAVDIPTGLDADTGALDPLTVAADLTVTFGLPKVGMYQLPGSSAVGRVQVIDIGIPKEAQEAVRLELLTARWLRGALPRRPEEANKGTFGRVLVTGGCRRYVGAPALAALGAYRAGAGLVTVACPETIQPMAASVALEATWLPLPADEGGYLPGETAIALRREWSGFDAAVLGCGLGNTEGTRAFVWAALPDLAALRRGCVIDADGLNALATFEDAHERLPGHAVLTPHPGEMARLLRCEVRDVQADRLGAAREAAARFGCTVVLKGAHTVVAAPDGRARLSPYANPLLATAGTGDVLAGLIAGYLAQGLEPFEAACAGVYVHAAAGESLREELGDGGLLAHEVAARVPRVVRELTAG